MNLYQFNGNNPVMFTDPFGLWPDLASTVTLPLTAKVVAAVGQAIGATADFLRNRGDMIDANTIGADKYFHCKGNCEGTKRGKVGEFTSEILSDARELYGALKGDPEEDQQADQKANQAGRDGAKASPKQECNLTCAPQRPRGLDEKY